MQYSEIPPRDWDALICPDLGSDWRLARSAHREFVVLKPAAKALSPESARTCFFLFDAIEGYALKHFNGHYTVRQVRDRVCQKFPEADARIVVNLIERLIAEGILTPEAEDALEKPVQNFLKPGLEWHLNPDGYWILWNRQDRTFLQVSHEYKAIIDQLAARSPTEVLTEFELSPRELQSLQHNLARGKMLANISTGKPRRTKFNPLKLLYFKRPLFNPNPWLNRKIAGLHWLWTKGFAAILSLFLAASLAVGLNQRDAILAQGQELMASTGTSGFIPFALLSVFVVTLHELGHAFTLKHYGRDVPEIGLLLMCFFPAAYTDTTEQYLLSKGQRIFVVGAGVLVQVTLAAIALLFWNLSVVGSGLHGGSYLLMVAALFTIAINLNPLAKFDGYYLAVAVTGINNLRDRSFQLYANLLTGQPLHDRARDALILAAYAPFSLFYLWFVFGFLFYRIFDWTWTNIPALGLMLLLAWILYYFAPAPD